MDQILQELNGAIDKWEYGNGGEWPYGGDCPVCRSRNCPHDQEPNTLDGFIFFDPERDHEDNYPPEIFLGTSDWVVATDGVDVFPAVFDHINHSWNRPNWTKSPLADVFWQNGVEVIAWRALFGCA